MNSVPRERAITVIISASRRTDIPALYAEWMLKRLEAGYAMMPNPRNAARAGKVMLSPELVDCIVFWTKNPAPILDKLRHITAMGYAYYFQFTLTAYGRDIEPHLPPKERLLENFAELSGEIGSNRVIWRYDPILLDAAHTVSWHIRRFGEICASLRGHTDRCVLSFIDSCNKPGKHFPEVGAEEQGFLLSEFSGIAREYGIDLFTCSETIETESLGIARSACIDRHIVEEISERSIRARIDPNQRPECRCIDSVDIGAYGTCIHGCAYCYATYSVKSALLRWKKHDRDAPMITGWPAADVIITDRTTSSPKEVQLRLV